MPLLAQAADTLFTIFFWLILIRAVLSWIRPSGYGKFWADLNRTLYALTEPVLAPIRNVVPGGGMGLDWSPLIALFLLQVVRGIVVGLLARL
jgi:YggT family protein